MQDLLDQFPQPQQKHSYAMLMQIIKQAPLFHLHTSSAPNALYVRVGYAGSHNASEYTKADHLPLQSNPTVYQQVTCYAKCTSYSLLHTYFQLKPTYTTYYKQL